MRPTLYYGQIRPSNYSALRHIYGCAPPWPLAQAPHVDLVQALLEGRDPGKTVFADYLRITKRPELLRKRVVALEAMLAGDVRLEAEVCCDCVLDGNHRAAVALATGRPLTLRESPPYQTIRTPTRYVEGRRLEGRLPDAYDFHGRCVLDLGCSHGMYSAEALARGAMRCLLVDHELTSDTWRVMDEATGGAHNWSVNVATADSLPAAGPGWTVLALSVVQHIGVPTLARLAHGRDIILETHSDGPPPETGGHRWTLLGTTPYSRLEPTRVRRLYLGRPL